MRQRLRGYGGVFLLSLLAGVCLGLLGCEVQTTIETRKASATEQQGGDKAVREIRLSDGTHCVLYKENASGINATVGGITCDWGRKHD